MPYPMHFAVAASSTQSMPTFHSESLPSSFETPLDDSAPYPNIDRSHGTHYRPSSSGSVSAPRPARKPRRGLGKMFGGVKKIFTKTKIKTPPTSAYAISGPTDVLFNGHAINEADLYAVGVRPQKSVRFSSGSRNRLHKAPPVTSCKKSAGVVTPTERQSMDAGDRQSLDEMRGRASCGTTSSGKSGASWSTGGISKAKSSKRSRSSRAASDKKRQSQRAEMAAQELLNRPGGFAMPEIAVTSPTTLRSSQYSRRASVNSFDWGDDLPSCLCVGATDAFVTDADANACRPSSARASMGSLSDLYVTNPSDGNSTYSVDTVAVPADAPATYVYSATSIANDIADHLDVAATLEGAFDFDFELQDVAMSDTLPAPLNGYGTFKARHEASRLVPSESAPSLGFIPSLPPFDLEDTAAFMPAPLSPTPPTAHVSRNRDEALAALEGYSTAPVPAALTPQQIPTCLMPGPRYTDTDGNLRASYTGFPTPAQGASLPQDYVEGPESYMAFRPQAQWEAKAGKENWSYAPQSRSQTPMAFADSEQHASHYARVESGLYDSPVERPANPSPPSTFSGIFSRSHFRPSSGEKQSRTRLHKDPPAPAPGSRKPVPSSAPAPAGPSGGAVPSRYTMNDNGYPKANLGEAQARFSATPAYTARTIDGVEAKFQRETGKSASHPASTSAPQAPQKSAKQLKAEQKAAEKAAEKERKTAKKERARKDVAQMDQAIGRIIS